jgi:hypothetical protein
MALNIWTGFHWCSPVNPNDSAMAAELLQKTSRWGDGNPGFAIDLHDE